MLSPLVVWYTPLVSTHTKADPMRHFAFGPTQPTVSLTRVILPPAARSPVAGWYSHVSLAVKMTRLELWSAMAVMASSEGTST